MGPTLAQTQQPAADEHRDDEYRDYKDCPPGVRAHYAAMRAHQSVEYVERMERKWLKFDHARMTLREAFERLTDYVDASDPDTALPNTVHAFQAAEAARAAGEPDWLQLTCLIHDVGKIMGVLDPCTADGQTQDAAQWGIAGDTWVVGHPLPPCAIMPELTTQDRVSVYAHGCGLDALKFAFGHDEYLYRVLVANETTLPHAALAMVRYHSCYPLHSGGAYAELLAPGDEETLEWVREFNKFDLYTKSDERPNVAELWPYYQKLIDKYLPGKLQW